MWLIAIKMNLSVLFLFIVYFSSFLFFTFPSLSFCFLFSLSLSNSGIFHTRGQYGIIRRCVNKCNGVVLAAKYLKDSNEASQEVKMLQNVSLSLPSCSHVMELVDAILTEDNLVIITEL